MHMKTNMRVALLGDTAAGNFATKLEAIGNDRLTKDKNENVTKTPDIGTVVSDVDSLTKMVYPELGQKYLQRDWLVERAILSARNATAATFNYDLQKQLPGTSMTYLSFDTTMDENQALYFPTEFLNSLEVPGVPSHKLQLKVGAPIMLLRNLNPPKLCNGTRLAIKQMLPNLIEATIMTGKSKGEDVLIPRIPIIPNDQPCNFKRVQFPIRLCFGMTNYKAQGQTLRTVGIDLREACFSHGQLYVACSRVGSPQGLYILAPEGKTANVVFPKALTM